MKVSIIIVTYNALDYVRKCLESVIANTSEKHQIVIIDNASKKDTQEYVSSKASIPNVKVVLNAENRLWSPANNQGMLAADEDSDFFLLLNSDVEVFKPTWIDELLEPMKYENVGITGTQYNFDPVWPTLGAVDGCCFMIRRKLTEKIGLLEEKYPWNGAGSVFTYLAWKNGWYYYHVDDDSLLIHYGKRSRFSSNIQLVNQKLDKFTIIREVGLSPSYAIIPYLKNKLGILKINDYLLSKIKN